MNEEKIIKIIKSRRTDWVNNLLLKRGYSVDANETKNYNIFLGESIDLECKKYQINLYYSLLTVF